MREAMFVVTEEWIKDNKTARGGWIAAQLRLLGEQWPPAGGWITRATGRTLTLAEKAAFEEAANSKSACRRMAKAAMKEGRLDHQIDLLERRLSASSKPRKAKNRSERAYFVEGVDVRSAEFLRTWAWRQLRYDTIKRYGPVCMTCGATPRTSGEPIQVDHIKPRSLFPWLAMDPDNLAIACAACNMGKSNRDFTDWRHEHGHRNDRLSELESQALEHLRACAAGY